MGLGGFFRKQFIDVIQWTESEQGVLAVRHPMEDMEIQNGASLTVRESQLAVFVNEGRVADQFGPGRYTLGTQTLPVLTSLMNWDKLFESPFKSDVYFFSTRTQTAQRWGTQNPITIRDKDFGMVRLRAFGMYGWRLTDPVRFMQAISGTREEYRVADLEPHLKNLVVSHMSEAFAQSQVPFLDMAANTVAVGEAIAARLRPAFAEMGLELTTFTAENLSLPDELQQRLDERIGMNMVGNLGDYARFQAAQSIPIAAANEGGIAGLGAGLGAGAMVGQAMAQAMNPPPAASCRRAAAPAPAPPMPAAGGTGRRGRRRRHEVLHALRQGHPALGQVLPGVRRGAGVIDPSGGVEWIIEAFDCDAARLGDPAALQALVDEMIHDARPASGRARAVASLPRRGRRHGPRAAGRVAPRAAHVPGARVAVPQPVLLRAAPRVGLGRRARAPRLGAHGARAPARAPVRALRARADARGRGRRRVTGRSATCPNCGAPVLFIWSGAVQTTCAYCQSVLVRHDVQLTRVGTVGDVPADSSPVQRGTTGRWRERDFTVVGRIVYEHGRGSWSEWHLRFADGRGGWLSDAQLEWAVSELVEPTPPLPSLVMPGQTFVYQGEPFTVTVRTDARYRGVEGELPFEYWDKAEVPFVDLRTPGGRFATVDYSDATPLAVRRRVRVVRRAAHDRPPIVRGMAGPAVSAPAVRGVRSLSCPSCGAAIVLRGLAWTQTVACASCGAVLDARDPNLAILHEAQRRMTVVPLIPLGARGEWKGTTYEMIGLQQRTITADGIGYSWREYLLFNPYQGYRYLTEYAGHWNDVVPIAGLPRVETGGVRPTAIHDGEVYRHFQTARAETTFVVGEFPWEVRVGDTVQARDYTAPPHVLSAEVTPEETTWSLGTYVEGAAIWRAFALDGDPPRREGIYVNQPSPHVGRVGAMWRTFAILASLLLLVMAGRTALARNAQTYEGRFEFTGTPTVAGEAAQGGAFVTPGFALDGRLANVVVETEAPLDNQWMFVDYALVNESTGEAYDVAREVSYYTGTDSDGRWTEGSRRDRARLGAIPGGRYFLRVEPSGDTGGRPVSYTVRVRRDVPTYWLYLVALVALLVPPIVTTAAMASFETRRWADSDYAPTGSADEDDDE